MSLTLNFDENELKKSASASPCQLALKETLIYLTALPDLPLNLQNKLEELIQRVESSEPGEEKRIDNSVQDLLFKLEHADHANDVGREAILRRIIKNILDGHFAKIKSNRELALDFKNMADSILKIRTVDELQAFRTLSLNLIKRSESGQARIMDEQEQATRCCLSAAVEAIGKAMPEKSDLPELDELDSLLQQPDGVVPFKEIEMRLQSLPIEPKIVQPERRADTVAQIRIPDNAVTAIRKFKKAEAEFRAQYDHFLKSTKKPWPSIKPIPGSIKNNIIQLKDLLENASSAIDEISKGPSSLLSPGEQKQSFDAGNGSSPSTMSQPDDSQDSILEATSDTLENELTKALENFSRHKTPYSLAMLGLDEMATVRGKYGIQVTEKIIEHVNDYLKHELRRIDFYEPLIPGSFIIILPNTTLRGAYNVVERLINGIETKRFTFQNEKVKITVSSGVSELKRSMSELSWCKTAELRFLLSQKSGQNFFPLKSKIPGS